MLYRVLFSIVLAVITGWVVGPHATLAGVSYVQIFNLIGQIFLNALSLVVVPLVASCIITGTARMGTEYSFGKFGVKVFGYFILTSFLAILVGLAVALLIEPGVSQQGGSIIIDQSKLAEIKQQTESGLFQKIELLILKIIPSNILQAASQGQMLGLIVFCLSFGYFSSKIETRAGEILLGFWKGVFQTMMKLTQMIMKTLPLGVFGLVAKTIASTGFEAIGILASFLITIVLGLFLYAGIILPLLLKFIGGVSPWRHIKAMVPALITGFSTTSSAATLPVTIECVEKRAGVSNKISSFILPLGTSINLTGSALYVCGSVLFIAQVYGISLSIPSICVIVLLTLIISLGSAGIPSAGLVSIVVILHSLGFPPDGIGLIMAVERILDMFRTPVNIFGTSCCAVLVAKSEGEKNVLSAAEEA